MDTRSIVSTLEQVNIRYLLHKKSQFYLHNQVAVNKPYRFRIRACPIMEAPPR
ncbi:hypothetical protein AG1IA_02380 [Rhizoctonia solani AG-1 IA]|uniref:Uncharacterized protein n=1 Tax=Thanatephorus cucumeris (strain AG1-IA) TaxID=983506 RepID=L8X3F6_THACA|nr:hypothetical protein AG1IA_02380 [Rhizoctonia solani AG-1 IA]